jgi:hypothetical protein
VPGAKPVFLDAHQMATLDLAGRAHRAGSTQRKVAPFVDQLLAVDTPDNQRKFLSALGWIDGEAQARYHHPWKALTEGQQTSCSPPSPPRSRPSRRTSGCAARR